MKSKLSLLAIVLLVSTSAFSQDLRINVVGNYVFDDAVDSYYDPTNYYNGKIKGGFQYGASFEFHLPPYNGFELIYIGQKTTATAVVLVCQGIAALAYHETCFKLALF